MTLISSAVALLLGTTTSGRTVRLILLIILISFYFEKLKSMWRILRLVRKVASGSFKDPIFEHISAGSSWRVRDEYVVCKTKGLSLWEWYLDKCGFSSSSPIRPYLHQVCHRELAPHMEGLFNAFERKPTTNDLIQISHSLEGKIHALNKPNAQTALVGLDAKEKKFLKKHMRDLFPGSDLEDFGLFSAWVELILLRRILKTVIYTISSKSLLEGIAFLKDGLRINMVVNLSLTVQGHDGTPYHMRIHTVTPRSKGRLSFIEESEEDMDAIAEE